MAADRQRVLPTPRPGLGAVHLLRAIEINFADDAGRRECDGQRAPDRSVELEASPKPVRKSARFRLRAVSGNGLFTDST